MNVAAASFWVTKCPPCDICLMCNYGQHFKNPFHFVFGKSNWNCVNNSHSKMTSLHKGSSLISYCNPWYWLSKMYGCVVWYLNICFLGLCDSVFIKMFGGFSSSTCYYSPRISLIIGMWKLITSGKKLSSHVIIQKVKGILG